MLILLFLVIFFDLIKLLSKGRLGAEVLNGELSEDVFGFHLPEHFRSDLLLFHLEVGALFLGALPGPFPSMINATFFEKFSHVLGGEAESFFLLVLKALFILNLSLLDYINVLCSDEFDIFIKLGLLNKLLSDGNLDLLHSKILPHKIFELESSDFMIRNTLHNFVSEVEVLHISAHNFHRLHLGYPPEVRLGLLVIDKTLFNPLLVVHLVFSESEVASTQAVTTVELHKVGDEEALMLCESRNILWEVHTIEPLSDGHHLGVLCVT